MLPGILCSKASGQIKLEKRPKWLAHFGNIFNDKLGNCIIFVPPWDRKILNEVLHVDLNLKAQNLNL